MEALTQSMLGMFLRCPHQFERRYLRGLIIPPGISARRGSATHKAAQINHEQKLHTQEDLPLDELQDAARDSYVRMIKEEGVFIPKDQIAGKDTLLAKGLDAAIRLTTLYRESLAPAIQPILVEEKMTMEVGLDLPLQGTIDVLTADHWLPDLKTADKSKGPKDADPLPAAHLLCRPGGPPNREVAREG
jgi:PD-(D/E)XK nuclease superfamily